MAFIRKAYGAHAHGQLNFTYFCEAQLVWDNVMAINALKYLQAKPEFSMVLLAGTGHAWKPGILEHIKQRSDLPYTVILRHVPESIGLELSILMIATISCLAFLALRLSPESALSVAFARIRPS